MQHAVKYVFILGFAALLSACGNTERYKQDSVWELYDVRTPLPADANIRSRASQFDPANAGNPYTTGVPLDNDAFYTPPTGARFGVCGEGSVGSFNCD